MTSYLPPTENLPIFDTLVFKQNDEPLTYAEAVKLFLKYPTAQGTENLQAINVAGQATFLQDVQIDGRLIIDSLQPYPTSYYVSKSGNDTTGTGSQSNPFLTIQKAITEGEALYNQFTIYIDQGSYTENLTITKGIYLTGTPDFDSEQFDFLQIAPAVYINGNITMSNTSTNYYVVFQNMYITCPSGSKILYDGTNLGRVCFQNCLIVSSSIDNIPLIQSTTGGYWSFASCRLYKQVNNTSATYDFSTADCQLYFYDTEITGNSSVALIAVRNGINIRNCSVNFGVITANAPIILHSGTSTSTFSFLYSNFQTTTNAGIIYKNTRTAIGGCVFYANRVVVGATYTAGVNYLFESTTVNLNLYIGNNNYYSYLGATLLDSPNQIKQPNITVIPSKQIANMDIGRNDITNTNKVNFTDGVESGYIGMNSNQLTISSTNDDIRIEPAGTDIYTSKHFKSTDGNLKNTTIENNLVTCEDAGNDAFVQLDLTTTKSKVNFHNNGFDISLQQTNNILETTGATSNLSWNYTTSTLTIPNISVDTTPSGDVNATYYPLLSSSNGGNTALYVDGQVQVNPSRNSLTVQNIGCGVLNQNSFGIVQCNDNWASGTLPVANQTIDTSAVPFGTFSPRFMEFPFSRKFTKSTVVTLLQFNHAVAPAATDSQSWYWQLDAQMSMNSTTTSVIRYYRATFLYTRYGNTAFTGLNTTPADLVAANLSTNATNLQFSTTLWANANTSTQTVVQIQQAITGTEAGTVNDIYMTGTCRLYYMGTSLNTSPITSIVCPI